MPPKPPKPPFILNPRTKINFLTGKRNNIGEDPELAGIKLVTSSQRSLWEDDENDTKMTLSGYGCNNNYIQNNYIIYGYDSGNNAYQGMDI